MPKHANQHNIGMKPCDLALSALTHLSRHAVPDHILRLHLEYCWQLGQNDKEIWLYMQDKYDHSQYSLSVQTICRCREMWGFDSSRATKKKLTAEQLTEAIQNVRGRFPKMGSRDMRACIRAEYGWWVPRDMLLAWFRTHEPHLIDERKAKNFRRKQFYAAGVNHLWVMDQHDKWQRFGLWLHVSLEPYTGKILWLKVWWTNSNPRLICSFYLDTVRKLGAMPLLTQSDPGSKNYGVANAQTALRHRLDPSLTGTSQHKWKRKKQNVKPEIEWSKLRRRWSPGFEDMLDYGLNNELFNPDDELEILIFRWLVIPYLQQELDVYVTLNNTTSRRHDPHKILPKGIPNLIFYEPHRFNQSIDFKIPVDEPAILEVEQRWAPPHHPVFQLVPPTFADLAAQVWGGIRSPSVGSQSMWAIFAQMVDSFRGLEPDPALTLSLHAAPESGHNGGPPDSIELTPGLKPANIHTVVTVAVPVVTSDPEDGPEGSEGGEADERIFATFSDEGDITDKYESGSSGADE